MLRLNLKKNKRLVKKYRSLKIEYALLLDELTQYPAIGDSIGHDCYKICLAIAAKGKGKSGGARVITHIVIKDKIVFLLYIFDKSEQENISDKELLQLLKDI